MTKMRRAAIIALLILAASLLLWAATAGPNFAGTGANIAGADPNWIGASNITTSNDVRATVALLASETSDKLEATNFSFAVSGTIDGIQVEVERCRSSGTGTLEFSDTGAANTGIKLRKASGEVGTGKNGASFTTACASEIFQSFGGAADTWSASLTAADVNDTNFGVRVICFEVGGANAADCSVDSVRITITHTPAGAKSKVIIARYGQLRRVP